MDKVIMVMWRQLDLEGKERVFNKMSVELDVLLYGLDDLAMDDVGVDEINKAD